MQKFAQVCKAEAIPELVEVLPQDQRYPYTIRVDGSKCARRLDDADIEVLVTAIVQSGLQVDGIALANHNISDHGVEKLTTLLRDMPTENYRTTMINLELPGNNITSRGCELLAEVLEHNKMLKALDLSWNPIGRRGGFRLAEMLVSNIAIESLKAGNVDFSTDTVIALLSLLRTNNVLVHFDIQNPRLYSKQEDTTKHMARVLEFNTTLQSLHMGKCAVGDDGATLLAEAMARNPSLRSLSLPCNKVGGYGAEKLATLLCSPSTVLSELDLSSNEIGDDGARAFAHALRNNSSLTKLDLRANCIGDAGLVALIRAMAENNAVREIQLWGNQFGRQASIEIDELIKGRFKYLEVTVDVVTYEVDGVTCVARASL